MTNKTTANDPLFEVRESIEKFLSDTADARIASERCRDYRDGKQWTDGEVAKLKARNQAPIVVNKIKPKVEGLIGLYNLRKSDPKAFPRTQKHEEASHVVTDGLRYVADNNNFDEIKLDVAENFFVEGYGGAYVPVKQKKNGDIEVKIIQIPWDRIYFDPHSRAKDFSDARWMGIILWMYADAAKETFPNADIDELLNSEGNGDETFEDRPEDASARASDWSDKQNNRVRIALHFEIFKSVWHMSVSSGDSFIQKPVESPFLDDDGEPANPIELVSATVARDYARYGEVDGFLDQQDEINHRRSKFLHFLNERQTYGRKGAPEDAKALKRELSKPNGHIEFEGNEFGKDFGILPSSGAERGQFELYLDAKGEMDAISYNGQLAGGEQTGQLSGKAIGKLQAADTVELNRQYSLLAGWEKRIYRQVWARIKQSWDEEKWIRVTDDQDNLRWVGFNTPITVQQALEEKINDDSEQPHVRKIAAQTWQEMMQAQDPRLLETIDVRNPIPELDVDIILDQTFDSINIQDEQFQMLAQFAQGSDVDIIDLIELSQLRGKDDLIEKIEKRRAAAAEAQGGALQLETQAKQAQTEKTQVETVLKSEEAVQKKIENQILINQPDESPQVNT